ncbi:hypothetical protein [Leucobacter luti]|uniref:hypothetical protein n=1 Tax=Leucobacter luti TaxID=340320 RepID=UPI00105B9919|nr:hypothetical protein [Leucobacter luti]
MPAQHPERFRYDVVRVALSRDTEITLAKIAKPVYVVNATQNTEERIIEQLAENEHRLQLTDSDRVNAWRQLEFEGLSVPKIAKRTGAKRDQMKTGLAVAANQTATTLVVEYGLNLEQAAILIEFDDDSEVVEQLRDYANTDPRYFPVAVERARKDRADRAACAEVEADERAKGFTILSDHPVHGGSIFPIHGIRDADGNRFTDEQVQNLPNLHVYVRAGWDDTIHRNYYLEDPAAHGYVVDSHYANNQAAGPRTEEEKAARSELIANNKEWDAATVVRRQWLAELLARKTLPKDAPLVIATALTGAHHLVSASLGRGNQLAKHLLGISEDVHREPLSNYFEKHLSRATHVTFAIVLGGMEETTSRETWRNPRTDTANYLVTLAAWGYPLTPVERIAAKLTTE